MYLNIVFTTLFAVLCANFNLVDSRVVSQRDVFDPPITYPTTGTVWHVGDRHNVTWNTSVLPPAFNGTGMIVLGFLDSSGDGNEHLDLANPLAKGFDLISGREEITVPPVTTRDSYILVLFGDSGNASPAFTITNITIGTPPSSSTSSDSTGGATPSSPGTSTIIETSTASGPATTPSPGSASTALSVTSSSINAPLSTVSVTSTSIASATSPASAAASTGASPQGNTGSRIAPLGGVVMGLPIAVLLASLL